MLVASRDDLSVMSLWPKVGFLKRVFQTHFVVTESNTIDRSPRATDNGISPNVSSSDRACSMDVENRTPEIENRQEGTHAKRSC